MSDAFQNAVWLGYADLEGAVHYDDHTLLDAYPWRIEKVAINKRKATVARKKAIADRKKHNSIKTREERIYWEIESLLPRLRRLLETARTLKDVEAVDTMILRLDERHHHSRPIWMRLEKPLSRAYDRVARGRVAVPSELSFPINMTKPNAKARAYP